VGSVKEGELKSHLMGEGSGGHAPLKRDINTTAKQSVDAKESLGYRIEVSSIWQPITTIDLEELDVKLSILWNV
jgi:hypothetical protein